MNPRLAGEMSKPKARIAPRISDDAAPRPQRNASITAGGPFGPSRPRYPSSASTGYRTGMCRSIKTLRRPDTAATTGELEAAARQYVRKISGYRTPAARNADAFDAAIVEVAAASQRLLDAIGVDIEEGPDRWTPRPARA